MGLRRAQSYRALGVVVGDTGPHHYKHIERSLKYIEIDVYLRYTYQSDMFMCFSLYLSFLSLRCKLSHITLADAGDHSLRPAFPSSAAGAWVAWIRAGVKDVQGACGRVRGASGFPRSLR